MTSRSKVPSRAPLYVRALRLRQLNVGGLASFLLFECMIAIGVLLALAELVSWWAVLILPVAVAIMVKVNDAAASAAARGRASREAQDGRDGGDGRDSRDDRPARRTRSAKASSRLDEWDDWDELTAPEKHGTTSLSRAELDRETASSDSGGLRKSTPLARALARQKSQAALGEDGRSSVPVPEEPPVEPPPAKQVGVIRISVPARDKTATGRATAPQQESRRASRHENQQEHRPAARSGTYEDGAYDEGDPYGRDHDYAAQDQAASDQAGYDQAAYDHAAHDHAAHDQAAYDHGDHERAGYERSGYERASYDRPYYDRPDYGHSSYDRPDYDYEPHGGAHRGGYLGANDSFHNDTYHSDESPTGGRHARGHRSAGHYTDDAFTSGGGRHSDNGRREDEITRQRSTLNQGRFA